MSKPEPEPQENPNTANLTARSLERQALFIHPGTWAVDDLQPLATLLGSCVAVCLYDPHLKLAGMNHFLLPGRILGRESGVDDILYGDYAMEALRNAMYARGASPKRLIAKAFGGGNVVEAIRTAIGTRNAEFAQQWLAREKIPLISSDFGGNWSRKVVFDPTTGAAYCKRLPIRRQEVAAILRAEEEYARKLVQPASKKVELF